MIDLETGEIVGIDASVLPVEKGELPFLRTAYNYDRDAASVDSGLLCCDPTLTQQQFKEEADINTLVERFGITGEMPQNVRVPMEGDFTDVVDFRTALHIVKQGEDAFMEMPAEVRKRFGNDPAEFLAFVHDPANLEEARKLGIALPKKEPDAPIEVRVVPTADEKKPA